MPYVPVIGLEVHAQLLTATKIFCGCSTRFGAPPNTNVCPVCLGLPGALPVLNRGAVELAVRAAHALNCRVQPESVFARKNYFYPDLPKGYQISQFDRPLAAGGAVEFEADGVPCRVRILRVHMEEDAGKSLHEAYAGDHRSPPGFSDSAQSTSLDFNRSGVPLIEIVTEPDLPTAAHAAEFLRRLRAILVAIGVNDGNMEEGSFRCDANVSVRREETNTLGTKTEVKNLNSFRFVQRALEFEIDRQVRVLSSGGRVVQETRLWDSGEGRTISMRSKEEAHDYRYFPEPDLRPLVLDSAWVAAIRQAMPELPDARRRRLVADYGIPAYDAGVLTSTPALSEYFEAVAAASANPKAASNWVMGDLTRKMNETGTAIENVPLDPTALAGLIRLLDSGTITGPIAKDVFERMWASGRPAAEIVAAEGLARIDDEAAVRAAVREAIEANPAAAAQYRAGRTQTFGFLVGQVMKATRGKANPSLVNALLRRLLDGEP